MDWRDYLDLSALAILPEIFIFFLRQLDGKQTCMNKIKQSTLQMQDDWIRFTFLIAAVKRILLEWSPHGAHMCSLSPETQKTGDLQTNIMKQEDKMRTLRGQRAEQRIKQIKHWSQTVRAAWCLHTHTDIQSNFMQTTTKQANKTILQHNTSKK